MPETREEVQYKLNILYGTCIIRSHEQDSSYVLYEVERDLSIKEKACLLLWHYKAKAIDKIRGLLCH